MKKSILTTIVFLLLLSALLIAYPVNRVKASSCDNPEKILFKDQQEAIQVFNSDHSDKNVSMNDIKLMAKTVFAESCGESFEGKVAVASVILNRLSDPDFPKTINGVILQKDAFSCVHNGDIPVVPNTDSYLAVLEALKGNDPTGDALYFCNPQTSTSAWMKNINKQNVKVIGKHVFFTVK